MLVSAALTRSLLLLQAIDAAASLPAGDAETAMSALNAMMTNWESSGLAMGWSNVSVPDATLPILDEDEEAVVYNLAVRLAPYYAIPAAMPGIADMAKTFLAELRRRRLVEMPLRLNSDLPCPERGGFWNIYLDGPA
jgi:hypothetical protein